MADVIQLLPDSIANQIAAGEVIQRPSSVVKELLENAIDANASSIKLILKEAGKSLIQVIDDGCGMSDTDARMSFERHATSKIRKAEDLFQIFTKGFRGEALASIVSISHVELITKKESEDIGRKLVFQGSNLIKHELCEGPVGSSFAIKNLFFNIPARRKFLKSNPVELKHILEEFKRVAIAHPEVKFLVFHDGIEIYHLTKQSFRQRLVNLFGNKFNELLIPIEEKTEIVKVSGFVCKPEGARKSRKDQFIFVNNRYIKNNYLNHAIQSAYEGFIPKDYSPIFAVFLQIDPSQIDINVHPSKTEIKFENQRLIYNYLRVAIKHALGQYALSPSLDFETDTNYFHGNKPQNELKYLSHEYNRGSSFSKPFIDHKKNVKAWETIYEGLKENTDSIEKIVTLSSRISNKIENEESDLQRPFQIHASYIVVQSNNGLLFIDQHAAHQRILYERNLDFLKNHRATVQKELFPVTLELEPYQSSCLKEILEQLNVLGFEIDNFGGNTFVVQGIPSHINDNYNVVELIEGIVSQYEYNTTLKLDIHENLSRSLAVAGAIKKNSRLLKTEMDTIVKMLFACSNPLMSPSGNKCYIELKIDDISKIFTNK